MPLPIKCPVNDVNYVKGTDRNYDRENRPHIDITSEMNSAHTDQPTDDDDS